MWRGRRTHLDSDPYPFGRHRQKYRLPGDVHPHCLTRPRAPVLSAALLGFTPQVKELTSEERTKDGGILPKYSSLIWTALRV